MFSTWEFHAKLEYQLMKETQNLAALLRIQRIARIGTWEWDLKTGRVTWSDVIYEIFGVDHREPSYEFARSLVHPDDLEFWERSVSESTSSGKPFCIDYRVLRPDGATVWIHNEAEIVRDADGRVEFICGTAQDITERKSIEEELRRSRSDLEARVRERTTELSETNEQLSREIEERKRAEALVRIQRDMALDLALQCRLTDALDLFLRTALQTEGVDGGGIYLVDDATGDVRLVSHEGLSPGFVSRVSHYPPDSPQARFVMRGEPGYWSNPQGILETGSLFKEEGIKALASIPITWKAGTIGVLNLASCTQEDIPLVTREALEATAAQIGSLIARIGAVECLEDSERRFRELAENIREIFWVRTPEKMLYISPVYEHVWGRTRSSLYQDPDSFLDPVHPLDRERIIAAYQAEQDHGHFHEEYRILRPDGEVRWIRARSYPVLEDGRIVRTVGIAEDITARRLSEEALRKSEGELRFLSSKLLSVQEEGRKRLARDLHDGLSGSLTAIKISLEATRIALERGEAQPTFLDAPITWTQNLIDEARRLMTELRPSLLDDTGLIPTLGWFFKQYRKTYPGIHIEEDISIEEEDIPEPLKIVIFRITQEAFHNMAKYSRAEYAGFSLAKRDGALMLTIEDNGEGFDLDAALTMTSESKGLGLTSMKERAELSGGSFEIRSTPGKGTTLTSRWPSVITA